MKGLTTLCVAAELFCLASQAAAQTSDPPGVSTIVYGQVAKIDRPAGFFSIRQVMPKNVGMVPITIPLNTTDDALLGRIYEGEKVKAVIGNVNGQTTALKVYRRHWLIQ